MTIQKQIIEQIKENNLIGEAIKDLLNDHAFEVGEYRDLYGRYKMDESIVPIFSREFPDNPNKVNNKLGNDFFGEIVDMKTGFMFGNPIAYALENEAPEKDKEILDHFIKRNHLANIDKRTGRLQAICGRVGRLLYIDKNGDERVKVLSPWEYIIIPDMSGLETEYALYYYKVEVKQNGEWRKRIRVEWYDSEKITYYIEGKDGIFILDDENPPESHMFEGVPIIEYLNNEFGLSDPVKVLSLIDGYDRTLSDINSENEQFANAYQVWSGRQKPSIQTIEEMKKTGAIYVGENGKVEWLIKQIDDAVIEHHLDRLDENICRFSKTPKYTDENFGGNPAGVALDHKMVPLETKSGDTEGQFIESNTRMFEVLASTWNKKGANIDPFAITQTFSRKYPKSLVAEAEIVAKLKGIVPDEIIYSIVSFIKDPKSAMEMMKTQADPANVLENGSLNHQKEKTNKTA